MTECLIIGCGGHGRQVRNWIDAEGRYRPVGWLDANPELINTWIDGLCVKGLPGHLPTMPAALGIGDNNARAHYHDSRCCINVIHPTAIVPMGLRQKGTGVVVGPFAVVDGAHARVGDGTIIHAGAQIHHDSEVGPYAFIGPGAVVCGHCTIGEKVMIGAGATLLPLVTVGRNAVVGAGTTITEDVPPGETMIQLPAITMSDYKAFRNLLKAGLQGEPSAVPS
jgi:sugar O-acyltransferase (sialic acid O-acetyltransferase NeuD family)